MNEKSCITINCGYCGNENQEITIYNKNEHGEYWKHPDGTLVCCAKKIIRAQYDNTMGKFI